ncbi:GyrI-like domain-containing protein [Neobacillus niacini]|uniref:GyrI-like domain-containing protein n=1 Tax=Neobacillus niacini TaxID=86668 RepID=UPI0005EF8561|nr:effector binding domain-containing protein [Neobacillus niacini]
MEIQVLEKEEIKVVGISRSGTYSQMHIIPDFFDEMKERLVEVPYQTNDSILIAPFHSRETEFTFYVTTPVEKVENVPDGMVGFSIPRKYYVCSSHKRGIEELENTYRKMLVWMQEYGYELDDHALCLEVLKHKNLDREGSMHFELYLPVKTYGNDY